MEIINYNGTLLALDQASKITGWAIFKNGYLKDSGIWEFKKIGKQTNFSGLLEKINTAIEKYQVTEMVAEDIYKEKKMLDVYDTLVGCKTSVIIASQQNSVPLSFVKACDVQEELIGFPCDNYSLTRTEKRETKKKSMMDYVKSLNYPLNSNKDDESDAIGIGIYFLEHYCGYHVHHPVDVK